MQAFLLDAAGGRDGTRFCLYHPPAGPTTPGAVVYVHPLAEEMNKSRRMAALQSRALAAEGYAVLQVDLLGCGDSSGDFGDATWTDWVEDVLVAVRWLRARHDGPLWLWGLRAGCLVASDAAQKIEGPVHRLYWQPPTSGRAPLQQFLRLASVAEALDGAGAGSAARGAARQRLSEGHPVEIAGYTVSPALAAGLESARLQAAEPGARTVWIEVSTRPEPVLLPASQSMVDEWRGRGCAVETAVACGPAFWQTTEVEDAPALVELTTARLRGH